MTSDPGVGGGRRPRAWRARHPWSAAAAGLVLCFLVLNYPLVFGMATAHWDADTQFAPWQMLVADFARHGRLLAWNPWSNGGSPDFAEPQFGAHSPVSVLYGLLAGSGEPAFRGYWLLLWLSGGLGMLVLARHLRAPPWGGFIVGLGFLFCGFNTGHASHTPFLIAFAALPWIVWRFDEAMASRRLRPAVESGAIWGLSALSGYPGVVVNNALLLALWALGRTLTTDAACTTTHSEPSADTRDRFRTARFTAAAWVAWSVVGLAVLSPTYVGFLVESRGYSPRSGPLPREQATGSNALHPAALATLTSPYLPAVIARAASDPFPTDVTSISLYPGIAGLWLAVAALVFRPRSAWRWWVAGIGLLGLGLAMGRTLPLRGWLYDAVPPTRYFRHASVFRAYPILAVLVLACYGARDLVAGVASPEGPPGWPATLPRRRRTVLAVAAGGLATAAVIGFAGWSGRVPPGTRQLAAAWFHAAALWPAFAVVVGIGLMARRLGKSVVVAGLLGIAALDAGMNRYLCFRVIETSDPTVMQSWQFIDANHSNNLSLMPPTLGRKLSYAIASAITNKNLPLKVPVLWSYAPMLNPWHEAWVKSPLLVAAVNEQRLWFAPAWAVVEVEPSPDTFGSLESRAAALGALPLVLHPRSAMLHASIGPEPYEAKGDVEAIARLPAATPLPATLSDYGPDRLAFDVEAPAPGYLLVTERWSRGWTATVDGHETPVLGANLLFRAVALPAGKHGVVFTYCPFGRPWLVILSWGTLAAVGAGALWKSFPRHRRVSDESSVTKSAAISL